MTDITTRVRYENDINMLGDKYSFLKNVNPDSSAFKNWYYKDEHKRGYIERKTLNVVFIGQTGYGKSSLLNQLLCFNIFKTDDVESCTKTLQCADYFLHHKFIADKRAYVLSFVDLPGIGENDKSDYTYLQWYKEYIEDAAIVIYLFRADKRDYTQDEFFFNNVFKKDAKNKLVCLLSQADKIEPLNRNSILSRDQLFNIEKKKRELAEKPFLCFYESNITYISSKLNINIDTLHDIIVSKLIDRIDFNNTSDADTARNSAVIVPGIANFIADLFG